LVIRDALVDAVDGSGSGPVAVGGLPGLAGVRPAAHRQDTCRRGTHRSTRALNNDIRSWIQTWNDDPKPQVWTKTADQIIDSIGRYCTRINDSRH
jgi:hypothetical protein